MWRTTLDLRNEDFLDYILQNYGDGGCGSLFSATNSVYFDAVIANPPYVRTQVMGSGKSQALARQFALSGRVDLYHAFLEGISRVLRPGGIVGIIVSNRFMTTKSGSTIRASILDQFRVLHVWDLGDTKIFEAAVLPCVLLLQKKGASSSAKTTLFTSIYLKQSEIVAGTIRRGTAIEALDEDGVVQVSDGRTFLVEQGVLKCEGHDSLWRISTDDSENWLGVVKQHTCMTFGERGKSEWALKQRQIPFLLRL